MTTDLCENCGLRPVEHETALEMDGSKAMALCGPCFDFVQPVLENQHEDADMDAVLEEDDG